MSIFDGVTAPTITVYFDTAGPLGPKEANLSTWAPIPTEDVRAISIRRGKTQENQSVQPGSMTLTLDNRSGDYDPDNASSPWQFTVYGTDVSLLNARLGVRVVATWNSITYSMYQGYMETVTLDYGLNPTATLTFVDGMTHLAQYQFETLVDPIGDTDTVRFRCSRIANQITSAGSYVWPLSLRDFNTAVDTTLYGFTFDGDALTLMQQAADCHPARLFVDRSGLLTLTTQDDGINTGLTLSDSQAAGTIGYDAIEVDPGSKYLINQVTINKVDGRGNDRGTVTVQDDISIARYGVAAQVYTYPLPTATPLATFLAYQYSEPDDRVRRITFPAMGLPSAQWAQVLASDLGDYCVVERDTMDGRSLSFNCQIEGVEHDLSPTDWRMGFVTSVVPTIPEPAPGPEPSNNGDPIPPSPPTGLTGTTAAYIDFREPRANVSLTWTAPTTNADGSQLTDLRWYEVQFKLTSASSWEFGGISYSAALVLSNLTVATSYDFRVFAVDSSNNKSAASNTFTITTANVTTFVGATPSTPTVSSRLGTLKIEWNGLNSGGGAMPADFDFVAVHVSTTSGFTPTSGTYKAQMRGADYVVLADLTYGSTYYVKLVAYNQSGIASAASAQASASIVSLVNTDIINNTITAAKIQDGTMVASDKIVANTITGALIQALAISADKIQANAITADKIQAGAIDGQTITGAIVRTSSGSTRAEMNSNGLYFYNGGVARVQLLNNGTATIGGFTVETDRITYGGSDVVIYSSGSTGFALDTTRTVQAKNFTATGSGVTNAIVAQTGNIVATAGEVESGSHMRVGAQLYVPNRATSTSAANVRMNTVTGQILESTSSRRYKKDIEPAVIPAASVQALAAVTYRPITDEPGVDQVLGLIAEEVAEIPVLGDLLVNYDSEGRPDSVNYDRLAVALLDIIKDLSARVAALEAQ